MEKHNYKNELIERLFEIGAIRHGEFILENGTCSPFYVDLKRIISFPDMYQYMVDLMWQEIDATNLHHIAGVPYAALPLASGIALLYQKSMLLPRVQTEKKAASLEGVYAQGDAVILVEDVIASGASVLSTIDLLEQKGLKLNGVVTFLDRQQGAAKKLNDRGIALHPVCTLKHVIDHLHGRGALDAEAVDRITTFINEHQF